MNYTFRKLLSKNYTFVLDKILNLNVTPSFYSFFLKNVYLS